jgi:hypothetical protein
MGDIIVNAALLIGMMAFFLGGAIVCLFYPTAVQRLVVTYTIARFRPFRSYFESPAYLGYLRFTGVLAAFGFLFVLTFLVVHFLKSK